MPRVHVALNYLETALVMLADADAWSEEDVHQLGDLLMKLDNQYKAILSDSVKALTVN